MDEEGSIINDILDSLDDLKITDQSPNEAELKELADAGIKSPKFVSIVSALANELAEMYQLDERVTPNLDAGSAENFLFEIGSFLSELGCPYSFLVEGNIMSRLQTKQHCLVLLLFLTSELQAAKMHFFNNPSSVVNENQVKSEAFEQLKCICVVLKMAKPPEGIEVAKFMSGIENKIGNCIAQVPKEHLSEPVIKQTLGPVHWEKLEVINKALQKEYETRRSMLLKRLDVTILSFNWSEKAKSNVDNIAGVYQGKRQVLKSQSDVSLSHLLAARDDISKISKTTHGLTIQSCDIKNVTMGNVPDRGGRTNEINAPLPEMPRWQKRSGGGGGGRGDSRGGNRDSGQRGRGGRGGGYRGDRPRTGGKRGGGGNWGRGRGGNNYNAGGSFERVFSHGGQDFSQGGFASGRQDYRS